MYEPETQEATEVTELEEQLERDGSGELRDKLIDELQVAAEEIRAALGGEPAAADVQVLKGLLEAVKLSESVVTDTWNAFHGIRGSAA